MTDTDQPTRSERVLGALSAAVLAPFWLLLPSVVLAAIILGALMVADPENVRFMLTGLGYLLAFLLVWCGVPGGSTTLVASLLGYGALAVLALGLRAFLRLRQARRAARIHKTPRSPRPGDPTRDS